MELLILGLLVGGAVGSKGKDAMKVAAKGALTAADKAREVFANVREDFRDAVEEARFEREQEIAARAQREAAEASTATVEPEVIPTAAPTVTAKPAAPATPPAAETNGGNGAAHSDGKASMDAVLEAVVGSAPARSSRAKSAAGGTTKPAAE